MRSRIFGQYGCLDDLRAIWSSSDDEVWWKVAKYDPFSAPSPLLRERIHQISNAYGYGDARSGARTRRHRRVGVVSDASPMTKRWFSEATPPVYPESKDAAPLTCDPGGDVLALASFTHETIDSTSRRRAPEIENSLLMPAGCWLDSGACRSHAPCTKREGHVDPLVWEVPAVQGGVECADDPLDVRLHVEFANPEQGVPRHLVHEPGDIDSCLPW